MQIRVRRRGCAAHLDRRLHASGLADKKYSVNYAGLNETAFAGTASAADDAPPLLIAIEVAPGGRCEAAAVREVDPR
jgi:hypothetical protein